MKTIMKNVVTTSDTYIYIYVSYRVGLPDIEVIFRLVASGRVTEISMNETLK